MQALDVITINIWSILISLCNLGLIFWLVKKFLFKPVNKLLSERRSQISESYAKADAAVNEANASKAEWEARLATANDEADRIVKDATEAADYRARQIVSEANVKADDIVRRAETEAALTVKKAEDGIKREIVEVSSLLTEKLLEREIRSEDHRRMIDEFIEDLGEDNE